MPPAGSPSCSLRTGSMAFPIPDTISDEVAVLADPFSVSLHAITRNPPPPGGRVLVYGAGALGTTSVAILRALYPDVEVASVARWDGPGRAGRAPGCDRVRPGTAGCAHRGGSAPGPAPRCAPRGTACPSPTPDGSTACTTRSAIPQTVEVGIRLLAHGGTLVQMGVASPARFEWTPWYFKELRLVGSNAFGVEEVDGERRHAIEHYLALVESGRIDLTGMLTHQFRLASWREAFRTIIDQGETGAVKVAFDFR